MIFRWQLSLPPPRPLPVTSSTNSLSPVLLPHRRTYSKRNPYSRIEQTVELVTHTGNRHRVFLATPLNLFSNLPGPLPITSCEKKLRVELWWVQLLVDIFRRQNLEVNKCDRFCPGNFIVWSLDMSGEFPWQLDYTPCCETIYKDMVLFLPFLFHHSSPRDVTETREI